MNKEDLLVKIFLMLGIFFGISDYSIFRIISLGSFVISFFLSFFTINKKRHNTQKNDIYIVAIILFYLVFILTIFVQLFFDEKASNSITLIILILVNLSSIKPFIEVCKEERNIISLFRAFSLSLLLHNAFSWYEIITRNYYFLSPEYVPNYVYRNYPASMFTNTNDLATILAFGVLILLFLYKNENLKFLKIFDVLLMISSIILIFKTGSRGNLIGLILGGISIVTIEIIKNRTKKIKLFYVIFSFFLLNLIILLLLYLVSKYDLFTIYQESSMSNGTEESNLIRIGLFTIGIAIFKNSNGLGIGLGNIEDYLSTQNQAFTKGITQLHNWWLEFLVTFGLIVFILYLFYYLSLLIIFIKKSMKSKDVFQEKLSKMIFSILTCFLISCISTSSLVPKGWIWMLFSLITAIAINLSLDAIKREV